MIVMKNKIFKIAAILVPALFAGYVAMAQTGTKAAIERAALENIWTSNTENAAGGMVDAPTLMANAFAGYDYKKGDFKPKQVGEKINSLVFHTDGGGIYKNVGNMYLWGDFTYTKDNIAGAKWNATLADPTRDMPFFVADENVSKWKNQTYDMNFKAGFPRLINNHLIIGIAGGYKAAIAAKQLDPRPLTRVSDVNVMPSIVWEFNQNNALGAVFHYTSYREDGSPENVNHLHDQKGWEMVAPGFFNEGVLASFAGINRLRNYNANALGGSLQYSFMSDKFKVLLSGDYLYRVEDVLCNYTKPQMSGTVKKTVWGANFAAQYNATEKDRIFFRYRFDNNDMRGIEYFQTYDNTYEIQSYITDAMFERSKFHKRTQTFNLDYIMAEGDSYSWKFGLNAKSVKDNFTYYVPETHKQINNLFVGADVTYNWVIDTKNVFTVNVNGGVNNNSRGTFDYGGVKENNKAFTDFALMDFIYQSSDYTKWGFNLTYSFCGLKSLSSVFVSFGYENLKPNGDNTTWGAAIKKFPFLSPYHGADQEKSIFGRRNLITFKVGLTF